MAEPKSLRIGNSTVGPEHPVLIVAEIGTGYGTSPEAAFKVIDAAKDSGADCVKFQAVFADEIVHPATGDVLLPGGATPLYDVFKSLERNRGFFRSIKEYTEKSGLLFLCSPFGERSAALLRELDVDAVKIASPELNHYPLLDLVADWGVPVIASTGVSTLGDIERALGHLHHEVVLLHCVTSYPAPIEDYNVACIHTISEVFGLPVGLSDHSLNPQLVPAVAAAGGARIIEKHFTLDKKGDGLDDPVALTPGQFSQMVAAVREVESIGQNSRMNLLRKKYGPETVQTVVGNGAKGLAASESCNYTTTNRSIITVRDIGAGEALSMDNVALLRSEKNIRPGLRPEYLSTVLGAHVRRDIASGTGLTWRDLID